MLCNLAGPAFPGFVPAFNLLISRKRGFHSFLIGCLRLSAGFRKDFKYRFADKCFNKRNWDAGLDCDVGHMFRNLLLRSLSWISWMLPNPALLWERKTGLTKIDGQGYLAFELCSHDDACSQSWQRSTGSYGTRFQKRGCCIHMMPSPEFLGVRGIYLKWYPWSEGLLPRWRWLSDWLCPSAASMAV